MKEFLSLILAVGLSAATLGFAAADDDSSPLQFQAWKPVPHPQQHFGLRTDELFAIYGLKILNRGETAQILDIVVNKRCKMGLWQPQQGYEFWAELDNTHGIPATLLQPTLKFGDSVDALPNLPSFANCGDDILQIDIDTDQGTATVTWDE